MEEYKKLRNKLVAEALSKSKSKQLPPNDENAFVDPATLPKNQLPEAPKPKAKPKAASKKD